jgi:hypothetical protein
MLLLSISILSPPYLYGIGYPVYYRSLGLPGGIELSFLDAIVLSAIGPLRW